MQILLDFAKNFVRDETVAVAGELTYKLMLSLFPLLVFMLSLMGYLHLDIALLDELAAPYLPEGIHTLLLNFVYERTADRNATLLSTSLLLVLVSSSSGFRSMMKGISRAHGQRDTRAYPLKVLISLGLTLCFCATVLVAVLAIVIRPMFLLPSGIFAYIIAVAMMMASVVFIYRMSVPGSKLSNLAPGAALTVLLWLASSHAFNLYFENFSSHSVVYGSIAHIFVLLVWLNAVSIIILAGAQLNAALLKYKKGD